MENINNEYFYRNKNELCEKWSFYEKSKDKNILEILLPIFLIISILILFL